MSSYTTVIIVTTLKSIANTTKSGVNNDNNDNSDNSDKYVTDFHNDFLSEEINNKQNNETELSHL